MIGCTAMIIVVHLRFIIAVIIIPNHLVPLTIGQLATNILNIVFGNGLIITLHQMAISLDGAILPTATLP